VRRIRDLPGQEEWPLAPYIGRWPDTDFIRNLGFYCSTNGTRCWWIRLKSCLHNRIGIDITSLFVPSWGSARRVLGKIRKELDALVQATLEGVRILRGNLSSGNGNRSNGHASNRRNTEHESKRFLALVNAEGIAALCPGDRAASAGIDARTAARTAAATRTAATRTATARASTATRTATRTATARASAATRTASAAAAASVRTAIRRRSWFRVWVWEQMTESEKEFSFVLALELRLLLRSELRR